MSEMALLLGLLVVSYLGSMLLAGRGLRGYGLPSGTEWIVLGVVLGPYGLSAVPSDALQGFAPMAGVSASWLALVIGSEYGYAGDRRASLRGFVLGIAFALLTSAVVAVAVYAVAFFWLQLPLMQAAMIAAGIGLAASETTRLAVRWATEHGVVPSALLSRIEEIAETDEIVPLVGVAVLFALVPSPGAAVPLSLPTWLLVTATLGLVLGTTCAMLLSSVHEAAEAWSVLLGAALLGAGIAWRLGVSPLTVMFVMGVTLCLLSRHGAELRRMLINTEPPVLLPMMLLGGALVRFDAPGIGWVIATALLARTLVRWLLGYSLGFAARLAHRERALLGLGMSSSGAVTMLIGLAFGFRFPGPIGSTVLCTAACMAAFGELLGPSGLRRALTPGEPSPSPVTEPLRP